MPVVSDVFEHLIQGEGSRELEDFPMTGSGC